MAGVRPKKVNVAARQVVQVRESQLHTARGAREVLAQAVADRQEMLALAEALRAVTATAPERVGSARAALREAAERLEPESKLRRQAAAALEERGLNDKLSTPIALPEPIEVPSEDQLHHGAAAVRRLSTALPKLGRKGPQEARRRGAAR